MVCRHGKVSPGFSADRPCRRQKNARFPDLSVFSCLPYRTAPDFPPCRAYRTALPFPGPTNAPCRAAAGCGQVRGPSAPVSSASVSPSVPPFSIRICSTTGADTVRIPPCRRQKNARFPDNSVFFMSAVSRPRIFPMQNVRNGSSLSRPDERPMPGGSRLWTGAALPRPSLPLPSPLLSPLSP